jgi:phosphopantothenate synthetase
VGRDEEAEQQEEGRRDEKLRREGKAVMVVDLGARRTADRAAALDYGASTVSADQVLAAHLESLPEAVPRAHLA